jgi:hypothetical protein
MQLTMYGRTECCLCDEMWSVVEAVGRERGVPAVKVDVDGDPDLADAYGDRVPVLCIDGVPAFVYRVTASKLRDRLAT